MTTSSPEAVAVSERATQVLMDGVTQAAEAHADLNMFAAISTLLESGHLNDSSAATVRAVERITKICEERQSFFLRQYDAATLKCRRSLEISISESA